MAILVRGSAIALALLLIASINPTPAGRANVVSGNVVSGFSQTTGAQSSEPYRPPERPRATVEIPPTSVKGRTILAPAGGDLQKALEEAKGGDRIELAAGATYRGPFRLRPKEGSDWIVISSADRNLPQSGRHVTPTDAKGMARLVSSKEAVLIAEPGAHHYRFIGLEMTAEPGEFLNTVVQFGGDEDSGDELPHHLIVDRCYIHGDPQRGARRGIAMNAQHVAVVDSYLSDFKERGTDTQAIAAWNGPGPFRIANNYLEAAGENVMFGGADPAIPQLVPSDIEIVRNHITKPLRWKVGHASFEGTEWAVKNLLELKNARRVLIDGNLFEYNWPHAQNGFAILFTVRNQEGRSPWAVVEDVTFSNNVVRHVAAGINMLGRDDNHPSGQTRRIAIRNNVFLDVGGAWENGRLFQLLDGTSNVSFEHNTAFQTGGILAGGDGAPHGGFVFENNVVPHNEHGITGSGTGPGTATLDRYFPGAVLRGNVIVGANGGQYPRDNVYPRTFDEVAKSGAGSKAGADVAAINRALGGLATIDPQELRP